jgi:two-component sensor histidine kinase
MHHRVRNNLQTISALLAMQLRRLDPESGGLQALRESAARIQSIAAVHNLLCHEDVGITTVEAVARQVIDSVATALISAERPVEFRILGDVVKVASREATVLALVINELISNALTHGLAAEGGVVEVDASLDGDVVLLEVRDDGPLHPEPPPRTAGSSGLGLSIIETLAADDLGGVFELQRTPGDMWTRAQIRFAQRSLLPDE